MHCNVPEFYGAKITRIWGKNHTYPCRGGLYSIVASELHTAVYTAFYTEITAIQAIRSTAYNLTLIVPPVLLSCKVYTQSIHYSNTAAYRHPVHVYMLDIYCGLPLRCAVTHI